MALRSFVSGHGVDAHAWLSVPAVAAPEVVDESIAVDEAAESLLSERFGFEFTQEIGDPEHFGGDRGVVIDWLTTRDGHRQRRPVGRRAIINEGRVLHFDDDLAVLDAQGTDRFAAQRFAEFGIGLYLRTPKAWRGVDGWWIEVSIQAHLLADDFRLEVERALAPTWRVQLSPDGEVVGRSN